MHFTLRIVRYYPLKITDVILLHADDVIELIVIRGSDLPRMARTVRNMHLIELPFGRRIHVIAKFFS